MSERNRIYGPVPSRRLGLSLGIDLAEMKHCPLDCVYCQLKATTRHDTVRESPATPEAIIEQVRARLVAGPRPDFLTLGGSGEPTLYRDLAALITGLRRAFDIPIALLTNAVLFGDPAVRRDAALADVVLPSLDAWDEASFKLINQPCEGISFAAYIDGLRTFREQFSGRIWLEVMILGGISDNPETVARLAGIAAGLRPDRIQLNTPIRPPAYTTAVPVTYEKLKHLETLFDPPAEATADFPEHHEEDAREEVGEQEVLEMLERRPCTIDDLAAGLGAHRLEIVRLVEVLVKRDALTTVESNGHTYYKKTV
ncbi:MAG TPA: radical SAM protein [Myxococcota bacterium]|nr:radical SAM protein [Myxococcota bacterium]HOD07531.1 radical SAM protein [Myxococcota bacterium]HPB49842.1 radical SAM protein [Myxococcota bacterium]HQP94873.1 radical SAM protein [Myxococcota bacterium]